MSKEKFAITTIITVSICLAFVVNTFLFVYSRTLQRPADDIVKIKLAEPVDQDYAKATRCVNDGGKPIYFGDNVMAVGKFKQCDFDKK